MIRRLRKRRKSQSQRGNIVLMLFAGIAMVGTLGVVTTNFMQGPLRSAVKITRQNTADTQMSIGGQVAIMAATNAANSGDCDSDGMIEPLEWLDKGTLPAPIGGGLVPMNIGISKKDPWGTNYGYCVWDYGTQSLQISCQETPGTNRRLQGTTNQAYPVVALVSAGPDKTFTTTCRNFTSGPDRADQNTNGVLTDAGDFPLVGKANVNDDDIITTYTYLEAMAASGGLWTLKANDPAKAVITKDLEVTGGATFTGTGTFSRLAAVGSDFLEMVSGLKLASTTNMPTCNLANGGVMRLALDKKSIEICDGAATTPAWVKLGAGGATEGALMTVAATGSFTKSEVGDYDVYVYTGNGTFDVTVLGTDGNDGKKLDYLIVGGGGGGTLAGGGAGGLLGGSVTATVQSYDVVVGAGGLAGSQNPASKGDGKDSSFAGLIAKGGGGGEDSAANNPRSGGSGGGGTYNSSSGMPAPGGAGTPGQGYAGCSGYQSGGTSAGGGGGGAGGNCGSQTGGAGVSSAITGLSLVYACGGAGSVVSSTTFSFGAGGCNPNGGNATPVANRGHGAGLNGTGSAGVVIIKVRQRGVAAAGSVAWPLKAPDGSAAVPSYSFTSLPAKGLYVDSGSVRLSGLAAPTANDQAANKAYVDTAVAAAASGGPGVTYLGLTSTSYSGNLGGYMGANEKCRSQYGTGARMMRYQDIKNMDSDVVTMSSGRIGCESRNFVLSGTATSHPVYYTCDSYLYQAGSYSNYLLDNGDCGSWRMTSHWSGNQVYSFTYSKNATSESMSASGSCAGLVPIHCVK